MNDECGKIRNRADGQIELDRIRGVLVAQAVDRRDHVRVEAADRRVVVEHECRDRCDTSSVAVDEEPRGELTLRRRRPIQRHTVIPELHRDVLGLVRRRAIRRRGCRDREIALGSTTERRDRITIRTVSRRKIDDLCRGQTVRDEHARRSRAVSIGTIKPVGLRGGHCPPAQTDLPTGLGDRRQPHRHAGRIGELGVVDLDACAFRDQRADVSEDVLGLEREERDALPHRRRERQRPTPVLAGAGEEQHDGIALRRSEGQGRRRSEDHLLVERQGQDQVDVLGDLNRRIFAQGDRSTRSLRIDDERDTRRRSCESITRRITPRDVDLRCARWCAFLDLEAAGERQVVLLHQGHGVRRERGTRQNGQAGNLQQELARGQGHIHRADTEGGRTAERDRELGSRIVVAGRDDVRKDARVPGAIETDNAVVERAVGDARVDVRQGVIVTLDPDRLTGVRERDSETIDVELLGALTGLSVGPLQLDADADANRWRQESGRCGRPGVEHDVDVVRVLRDSDGVLCDSDEVIVALRESHADDLELSVGIRDGSTDHETVSGHPNRSESLRGTAYRDGPRTHHEPIEGSSNHRRRRRNNGENHVALH